VSQKLGGFDRASTGPGSAKDLESSATPPEGHDPYLALRFPEYRAFLASNLALFMAMQIQSVVLGWQVYSLTGDPLSLGLVGLAEALPFLAFTLVGGHAADRFDRRTLSLLALLPLLLASGLLLLVNLGPTRPSVAVFYGVQVLGGLARAFFRPASQALGTEIVPTEAYGNAATWRSGMFHLAMVAGPALGGLLFGFGSASLAYGVQCGLMLFGFLTFLFGVSPRPRTAGELKKKGEFFEGVRFVFREKVVLGALSLDLFAVLFGGAPALLPVFAKEILLVGPEGLGLLRAAPALGAIFMSVGLAFRPPMRKAGRSLLVCVGLFGLTWVAFAVSRSFTLSLGLLALGGAFDTVSVVLRATLVQTRTPKEMMGRVAAVNSFFIGSSNELGAFESGVAARLLGTVPSVIFGGCMTLAVVALMAWRVPTLRKLERIG
jgi:MFS family permease